MEFWHYSYQKNNGKDEKQHFRLIIKVKKNG